MANISRIGVVSDTHGVIHPALADVFASVDHIVHAGDIGGAHVLRALGALAPVTSVDGNMNQLSRGGR
ncbi:MAG TPA: metallophosphoesterase family protein [Thermoanaerobaculia bacterium]|nr:metallophosphoesterase family protein [Thermoanaerobaculia bacterium]